MVEIHGNETSQDEYEAAVALRNIIIAEFPDIETAHDRRIDIIVSAKTPKHHRIHDIDLVLLARFNRPIDIPATVPKGARSHTIHSIAATIEVKNHPPERVMFSGQKILTEKYGKWRDDAWEQTDKQKFALQDQLKVAIGRKPWVNGFTWLRQVERSALKKKGAIEPHPYLPRVFTFSDFCRQLLALDSGSRLPYENLREADNVSAAIELMTRKEVLSGLDRRRIELLANREVKRVRFDNLGTKQYIITGRGGTGKTIYLLRLAQRIFDDRLRVLVLTYNKALVADLRRQLRFIGLRDDLSERAVRVQTLHSFFHTVLIAFSIIQSCEIDSPKWFDKEYSIAMEILLSHLHSLDRSGIENVLADNFSDLGFNYACIDEGQDWSDTERDVLHQIFGVDKCLIVDGEDQLIRANDRCVWNEGHLAAQTAKPIYLRSSLRMKNQVAVFANRFAERIGLSWSIDPMQESIGGNVILLLSPIKNNFSVITDAIEASRSKGHALLDNLCCVPWQDVYEGSDERRHSILGDLLKSKKIGVWDAVDPDERIVEPDSLDQMRIVQYDSSRGLEGWLVVAKDFDLFFDNKYNSWEPPIIKLAQQVRFVDSEFEKAMHAARWAMIPLTRAIDTLIISFADSRSQVARLMLKVAENMPDSVTIIN